MGVPRATFDIDIMVEIDEAALQIAFDAFEQHGFAVDASYRKGWRDRIRDMPLVKVQVFRDGRGITSDLFLVETPFQRSAFARATTIRLPGVDAELRVVAPADLLLFKLLADRPKDLVDVQNVLTVQGLPEPDYLRRWAKELGVGERLDRALADAGFGAQP